MGFLTPARLRPNNTPCWKDPRGVIRNPLVVQTSTPRRGQLCLGLPSHQFHPTLEPESCLLGPGLLSTLQADRCQFLQPRLVNNPSDSPAHSQLPVHSSANILNGNRTFSLCSPNTDPPPPPASRPFSLTPRHQPRGMTERMLSPSFGAN